MLNISRKKRGVDTIKFTTVLSYLKKLPEFQYKAIRVWPIPHKIKDIGIRFNDKRIEFRGIDKVQICFFDKTLLTEPYSIVEKCVYDDVKTIR